MATFSELQTRVQRLVIDLPSAVTTEVPELINEAIKGIQEEHNFKVMEALVSAQQTTVATRTLTSVPSTLKDYRDEPYLLTSLGEFRPLSIAADRVSLLERFPDDSDGEPKFLLEGEPSDELNARSWEVWPLPDGLSDFENGEYRVYIPYWKFLTELSASGDQNWFTVNGEEYIVESAAARAFMLDWDMEGAASHFQLADNFKKRLIKRDKMFRIQHVTTLVPHWQGEFQPKLRR